MELVTFTSPLTWIRLSCTIYDNVFSSVYAATTNKMHPGLEPIQGLHDAALAKPQVTSEKPSRRLQDIGKRTGVESDFLSKAVAYLVNAY